MKDKFLDYLQNIKKYSDNTIIKLTLNNIFLISFMSTPRILII